MTHHIHVPPALGMGLGSYDAGFKLMVINYIDKTNNCKHGSKHTKVEATKAEVDKCTLNSEIFHWLQAWMFPRFRTETC
jgi:hypothetical protein